MIPQIMKIFNSAKLAAPGEGLDIHIKNASLLLIPGKMG